MKTRWYQYIKIFGFRLRGKVYHQLIYSSNKVPRDFPPKDREFFVYCVDREKIETDHVHTRRVDNNVYTSTIKGRGLKTIWIGQAKWNEKNQMFDIRTTAGGHENGFVSVPELEERMLWSYDLPLNLISKR